MCGRIAPTTAATSTRATTDLGAHLLKLMAAYPTRFVLGTDADNGLDADDSVTGRWGIETYAKSIAMYLEFLADAAREDSAFETARAAIIGTNADLVLYG
jgi:hypothetical protein